MSDQGSHDELRSNETIWEDNSEQRTQAVLARWYADNPDLQSQIGILLDTRASHSDIDSMIVRLKAQYSPGDSQVRGIYEEVHLTSDNGMKLMIRKYLGGQMSFEVQ